MAKALSQDANETEFNLEPQHLSSLFAVLKKPSLTILAKAITDIPALKEEIVNLLSSEISSVSKSLGARKHNPSVLMAKDFESLKTSNIEDMVAEFKAKFPSLFNQILALMIPEDKKKSPEHYQRVLPRIAMVYSVMLFTRNNELSLFQRQLTMAMKSSIVDQKVRMLDKLSLDWF